MKIFLKTMLWIYSLVPLFFCLGFVLDAFINTSKSIPERIITVIVATLFGILLVLALLERTTKYPVRYIQMVAAVTSIGIAADFAWDLGNATNPTIPFIIVGGAVFMPPLAIVVHYAFINLPILSAQRINNYKKETLFQ